MKVKKEILKRNSCSCDYCKNYDKYMWATISECGCACHDSIRPSGHDSLCCEFPNGVRKLNPYKKLKKALFYATKLT